MHTRKVLQSGMLFFLAAVILCVACGHSNKVPDNVRAIDNPREQDSLFRQLTALSDERYIDRVADSIAVLLLPVDASCPACRKKAIDSISKYQDNLDSRHYVVVSGRSFTAINKYFLEQNYRTPLPGKYILLDSIDRAFKLELVYKSPVIYYAFNSKVYQKVSCSPKTIRKDLRDFFSHVKRPY